ncbi:MAG TPA: protein translocase subunit SecF, partial [Bacteroidota bacterium]|nr:protein translocase subunit SecF [Bacteroidota bacterium]
MRFFKKTNIDFMGKRKLCYTVSLAVIAVGLISIPLKGGLDYGIDFTGGTEVITQFQPAPDISEVRTMMDKAGFEKNELKTYGDPNRILMRTQTGGDLNAIREKILSALQGTFPDRKPVI